MKNENSPKISNVALAKRLSCDESYIRRLRKEGLTDKDIEESLNSTREAYSNLSLAELKSEKLKQEISIKKIEIESKKLRLEKEKLRLVSIDEVNANAFSAGAVFNRLIMRLPSSLPSKCEGKTASQISYEIELEINSLLLELEEELNKLSKK